MSSKPIRNYDSISAFFQSVGLPIDQFLEFTIHPLEGLHGSVPFRSPDFRTNYHAFLLIQSGSSEYTIDGFRYQLGPGSFYFTTPGHVKSFSIFEELSGFMITFSDSFLKSNYPGETESDFPFLYEDTIPVMQVDEPTVARLASQMTQIRQEYLAASPLKERLLGIHLAALLLQTRELLITSTVDRRIRNRPAEITRNFKLALNRHIRSVFEGKTRQIWKIRDFASVLNIHPNHLSNTIRQETGKTVGDWIDGKLTDEAIRLLKTTSLPVSEIAWKLAFSDASNFTRFFRRQTGKGPGEFRNL